MAHYAFIDENNVVVEVIKGRDETEIVDGIESWEKHYEEFRPGLRCLRTSRGTIGNVHYNGLTGEPDDGIPFRKNYAVIGGIYDEEKDAFIGPKPFPSWTLDEETCLWEPPIPRPEITPENTAEYSWDEETLSWVEGF